MPTYVLFIIFNISLAIGLCMLKEQTALLQNFITYRNFLKALKKVLAKKKIIILLSVKDVLKRNIIYEQEKKFLPEVDNYYGTYPYHNYLLKWFHPPQNSVFYMELLNILLTWEQEKESYAGLNKGINFFDSALFRSVDILKSHWSREAMQSRKWKSSFGHESWCYVFQQIKFEEQFSELFICQCLLSKLAHHVTVEYVCSLMNV